MSKREGGKIKAEPSGKCKKKRHQDVFEAKAKKHETNEDGRSNAEGVAPIPGVRFRKWGSCVAEVKDSFTKQRVCLGTFDTIEEANEAVRAKKEEFRLQKEVQARMDQPIEGEGDSRGLDLNQIPRDHNGYLLGVYRNMDDTLNIE